MVTDVEPADGRRQSLRAFAAEYEAKLQAAKQREGTLSCTQAGCGATTGVACEYVDRRGRSCRTAWCPEHRVLVEDHAYCRRHAGVVGALPDVESSYVIPLPDVDNRAPSLVGWMARQIDADVWRLLLASLDTQTGGQLISDPVTLIFTGLERRRAWERAWKVVSHTGLSLRVSLSVEEDNDEELAVKVGTSLVDRVVPPWIVRRHRGERLSAEDDARERTAFNERLMAAITRGVEAERREAASPEGGS